MTKLDELVLLLGQGTESQELNMLITIAKKRYVQEHHHRAISQMTNATGYKKDKWKTYVIVNDKRKEIIRNTEEELYASLYEHYSELEKKPKTIEDVFEQMKDYKLNALARSQKTVVKGFMLPLREVAGQNSSPPRIATLEDCTQKERVWSQLVKKKEFFTPKINCTKSSWLLS
jgi:hypothetical protein